MEKVWYYVEKKERKGPVKLAELKKLMDKGVVKDKTFLWTKGFEGWKKLEEVEELKQSAKTEKVSTENKEFDWERVEDSAKIFSVKIGVDRGGKEVEYGPFNMSMLRRLYDEKRINAKTLLFAPGFEDWIFLADIPVFEKIFDEVPVEIKQRDRRASARKPFVAKILFHDADSLYEGVCRDVSVGGLQILVADFPAQVGSKITLNVHPDNSSLCFAADAEVVRILGGNSGFSVRFIGLNTSMREAIDSYVKGC